MNKCLLFSMLSITLLSHVETFTDQPAFSKKLLLPSVNHNEQNFSKLDPKQTEIDTLQAQKQKLIDELINNLIKQVNNFNEFKNSGNYGPARHVQKKIIRPRKTKNQDNISMLNHEITKIQDDISSLKEISQGGSLDVTQLLQNRLSSMKHILMSEK